jgi:DNA-binding response OmpR family regulator
VVEDSFLVAAALEDTLVGAGHRVCIAGSVAEARQHLAKTAFKAALLDYILPDGNSLMLARQLHAGGCQVAVISGLDSDVLPHDPAIAVVFAKPMDDRLVVEWVGSLDRDH